MLVCEIKMRLLSASGITCLIAAFGLSVCGQAPETKGMPPRATPGDYQAQAKAGKVTIAAEFMGHSVPRPEGPLTTEDYVVIETGFFGPAGERVNLSVGDFSLKINGKKKPIAQGAVRDGAEFFERPIVVAA